MSDEQQSPNTGIPPKLDLRKSGALPGTTAQPGGESAPAKKKTTRIPLTQAESGPAAAPGALPKTIRLAPPPTGPRTLSIPTAMPAAIPAGIPTGKPVAPEAAEHAKSQTSRIPLESAFASDEAAAEAGAGTGATPKTIRIKRPSATAPTMRVAKPPAAGPAPAPVAPAPAPAGETLPSPDIAAEKSKTSRVDLSSVTPPDSGQATQRKTIKIRRPEGGAAAHAPRSIAVARIEAEAAQRHIEEAVQPVSVAFPILAAVATVVVCVLLYILMAQSFPTLNWSFPGQVTL